MEIETAVRRLLLGDGTVTGYVGRQVFKYQLDASVDGTGKRAIVVRRSNGWAVPADRKTQEYPILAVDCYADAQRDSGGDVVERNSVDSAYAVYRAVDPLLHGVRGVRWGAGGADPGLMVLSCQRWSEPFHVTEQDRHADDPPLGEAAKVTALYAVCTVH